MIKSNSLRVIIPVFIVLVAIFTSGCRPGAEESLPFGSAIGSEQIVEQNESRIAAQPVRKTTFDEVESQISLAAVTEPKSPAVLSAETGNDMSSVNVSSDITRDEALISVDSLDDASMPEIYLRSIVKANQDLNSIDGGLSDDSLKLPNTNAVNSSSDNSDNNSGVNEDNRSDDCDGIYPDSDDDLDDIDDSDSIDDNSDDDEDDDYSCEDDGDDDSEDGDDDGNHDDDHGDGDHDDDDEDDDDNDSDDDVDDDDLGDDD